jgi:hypothetical protein
VLLGHGHAVYYDEGRVIYVKPGEQLPATLRKALELKVARFYKTL